MNMPRFSRLVVRAAFPKSYTTKESVATAAKKAAIKRDALRMDALIAKTEGVVKDTLRTLGEEQKEIDALSVEIKETQARTKAILDTF